MKRKLTRKIEWNGKMVTVDFEYWPGIPESYTQPGDAADFNLLSIVDDAGKNVDIPVISDDGGNGDWEKLTNVLLDGILTYEAMSMIAIEPWD